MHKNTLLLYPFSNFRPQKALEKKSCEIHFLFVLKFLTYICRYVYDLYNRIGPPWLIKQIFFDVCVCNTKERYKINIMSSESLNSWHISMNVCVRVHEYGSTYSSWMWHVPPAIHSSKHTYLTITFPLISAALKLFRSLQCRIQTWPSAEGQHINFIWFFFICDESDSGGGGAANLREAFAKGNHEKGKVE